MCWPDPTRGYIFLATRKWPDPKNCWLSTSLPTGSQQRQRNKLVTIWERGENSIEKMLLIIAQLKFQQSPCCRFWDRLVNLDVIKVWRTLASAFRPLLKIILSAGHQSKPALSPAMSRVCPPLVQSPHLKTNLIHQLTLHHLDYHLYRETQFFCTSHLLTDATCNNKICWCVKPWPLGKEKLPALLSVTKINYVYTQCIHEFKLFSHPLVGSIFTRRKCKTEKTY